MLFRPEPPHRRRQNVIYPLTEAIRRLYVAQPTGAYPLGAFYTENISNTLWRSLGGIWYEANSGLDLDNRAIDEETVLVFMQSIQSGESVELPGRVIVGWERIPDSEANELCERSS